MSIAARRSDKADMTLGELYRRMSADFRAVRPADHGACVMPMVVPARPLNGANWSVEPLTSFCPFCHSLAQMIVAEYAPRYDVRFFPEVESANEPLMRGYYCAAD